MEILFGMALFVAGFLVRDAWEYRIAKQSTQQSAPEPPHYQGPEH